MTEIVATRTTLDGVTVYLHADGKLSTRNLDVVYGAKLAVATMFRAIDDLSLYEFAEIKAFCARKPPFRRLSIAAQEELMQVGSRERMAKIRADLTYNRNPWKRSA